MKTCSTCKIEKPANTEYFCKQKKHKDGLSYTCKDCDREYRKQRKAENMKKKFIYDDKKVKECNKCKMEKPAIPDYFHKNIQLKDGLTSTCKECRKKKSQKEYQENKEYYREHRQENRKERMEYNRNYYKENEDYFREYSKKHYKENKEWYREYAITYHLENPEVNRLKSQRRRARMAQLPHTLTVEEWEETLEYFDYSCAYCGDSESGLAQEHVIPVSKGGPYTHKNIIPACQSCNKSKYARDLEEWYLSYKHYDEEKLNKILDYVEVRK